MKNFLIITLAIVVIGALILAGCAQPSPSSTAPASTAPTSAAPKTTSSTTPPASSPAASSPASAASGKTIELRMGYTLPPGSPPYNGWEWFAQELATETNGQVTLKLYPGGTLVQASGMLQGIETGITSFGFAVLTSYTNDWPLLSAFLLPSIEFPKTEDGMLAAGNALFTLYKEFPDIQVEFPPSVKVISAMSTDPFISMVQRP